MTGDVIAIVFGCAAVCVVLVYHIRRRLLRAKQKEQLIEEYTKGVKCDGN